MNKVVVEIEIDLRTLTNATSAPSMGLRDLARINIMWRILDALSPEDKIRLEKYQKGDDDGKL